MRVIEVGRRGGPEVLNVAERAAPDPGPGQVVVRIAAAGVNFMDIYQREGVGGYRPALPFVPGAEGAGTIIATGDGVTGLAVGDQVAWAGPGSSYAEQAALPADRVVVYGAASGQVPPFDIQRLNSGGSLFATRPTLAHYIADPEEMRWRAGEVLGWIAGGELDVRIGGSYPLADAARAHEDLAARRTTGKLLLIP